MRHQDLKWEMVARLPEAGRAIPLPMLQPWIEHKRATQRHTLDGDDPPGYGG